MDPIREQERSFLLGIGHPDPEAAIKEVDMQVSITEVARQIRLQKGLSESESYKEARKEMLKHERPLQEGFGRKDAVLEALDRIGSRPGVNFETLMKQLKAMQVHINQQEVLEAVWGLKKLGFVTFNEGHMSGGSTISRIRQTPAGRTQAQVRRGESPRSVGTAGRVRADRSPKTNGRTHKVGVDATDYRNHRNVAEGGPIERIQTRVYETEQEIIPAVEYKSPPKLGDPLPQNQTAPLLPPLTGETEPGGGMGSAVEVMGSASSTGPADTHTQYPVDAENFPYLFSLVERRSAKVLAREKAAKLVEAASSISNIDPEGAEILMTRAADLEGPSMTREELEILRFLDQAAGIPEAFRVDL